MAGSERVPAGRCGPGSRGAPGTLALRYDLDGPDNDDRGRGATVIDAAESRSHVISGTTIMVKMRSRRRSIVRVALIAGTAHAKPNSIGTNARPCRFIDRMMRSIRYATRAR